MSLRVLLKYTTIAFGNNYLKYKMAILKNTIINDTGHLTLPVGTTVQRPVSPTNGMTRVNTTLNCMEVYHNGGWKLYSLDGDVWGFCVNWLQVLDNQSFHQLRAESLNTITQLSYQVVGIHATPINFSSQDTRPPNIRIHSTLLYLPLNSTTYTIIFYKVISGIHIQVSQDRLTTRSF